MLQSATRAVLTSFLFIFVLAAGCSSSNEADNPNSKMIEAVESAIKEWKKLEDSGEWQEMIKDGVAADAIDNDSYLSKPQAFPKFKIGQLEKQLKELKESPDE